jgi:hypothetical protein
LNYSHNIGIKRYGVLYLGADNIWVESTFTSIYFTEDMTNDGPWTNLVE